MMTFTHMIETETIESVSRKDALASTQSGLVVSTEALSGRFINPPPGKLYLLYGAREIFHLSLVVASKILGRHRPIAIVDGANRFDAYYLARTLREQHGNPGLFLNNIYVSRGFTCYQMEAAITQRLPQFLRRMKSKTAMIFGLLDTFYDEQAKFYEVQKSLQRILRKLHEMKNEGVSILIASLEMKVLPEERNRLFRSLKSTADQIYRFDVSEEHCQLVQMKEIGEPPWDGQFQPLRTSFRRKPPRGQSSDEGCAERTRKSLMTSSAHRESILRHPPTPFARCRLRV
jgi:hypothetical protein